MNVKWKRIVLGLPILGIATSLYVTRRRLDASSVLRLDVDFYFLLLLFLNEYETEKH